ncbi:hypothetical protein EBT16_00980 [bacterium]|nr:hypothetical protein [bacterium]
MSLKAQLAFQGIDWTGWDASNCGNCMMRRFGDYRFDIETYGLEIRYDYGESIMFMLSPKKAKQFAELQIAFLESNLNP